MDYANSIAPLALILWLPFSVAIFGLVRPPIAALIVLLGGTMFLPERVAFHFEGLPDLGKREISVLAALLGSLIWCPGRLVRARPGRGLESLVLMLVASSTVTVLTNRDLLFYGPRVVEGLTTRDAISMVSTDVLTLGIPFFLGRAFFQSRRDLVDLMRVLAIAGLVYAPLVLFEARISPRLNIWVYGFHQHDWRQIFHFGGYRPLVFMHHGLALALFVLLTSIGAMSLARARLLVMQVPAQLVSLFLIFVLLICKSLAAIAYGVVVLPVVALARAQWQLRLAILLVACTAAYPLLRLSDIFPSDVLVSAGRLINEERALSLQTRFDSEDELMSKAIERTFFGWGIGRGRNVPFNERGLKSVVMDGYWIILLSQRGLVGLGLTLAMLLIPVVRASPRRIRGSPPEFTFLVAGLSVCLAVSILDLLPNGLFTSIPFFLAGALSGLTRSPRRSKGHSAGIKARRRAGDSLSSPPPSRRLSRARDSRGAGRSSGSRKGRP